MLAAASLGVAALAAAAVFGWGAANSLAVAQADRQITETTVVSLPDYSMSGAVRMPDVRGLSEADARQALVDAGLPASVVTVTEKPAAGNPGRVIQQTPVFGMIDPQLVTLTVSAEARVPDLIGVSAAAAVDELQQLGARVEQVKQYVPGATIGDVAATVPEAGKALTESVQVVIADTAVTRILEDFEQLAGGAWSSEDVMHLGKRYDTGLELGFSPRDDDTVFAWRLGGKAASVEGLLALEEDHEPGASADVVVLGDGVEIARFTLSSSAPLDFTWDVRAVDTLSILVTTTGDESGSVMLLDPRVLGSFDDLSVDP